MFAIRYMTKPERLAEIEAAHMTYSGGDGVVIAAFFDRNDKIVALAALQAGMVVEKVK